MGGAVRGHVAARERERGRGQCRGRVGRADGPCSRRLFLYLSLAPIIMDIVASSCWFWFRGSPPPRCCSMTRLDRPGVGESNRHGGARGLDRGHEGASMHVAWRDESVRLWMGYTCALAWRLRCGTR